MLAIIRSRAGFKIARLGVLACFTAALASCASNETAQLINDPNDKKETALPWNEQQKWEREGEAAALTQSRR
jgi:hypothetical protein